MPIDPEMVYLSGGGANSPVWCQIMADCLGKPMSVPEGSQFGAKGAALNIGVAVGLYKSVQEAVHTSVKMARLYSPRPANSALYQQLFEVYKKTAERQMDLWDLRAEIMNGAGQHDARKSRTD
jgi:sugar (pentulose or hexulose) kinase